MAHHAKPIFCEKPLCFTAEECREAYAVARENSAKIFVAFTRRFDPSYREVFDRVRTGEIGDLFSANCMFGEWPKQELSVLRTKGSVISDTLIHDVDYLVWLT